MKKLVIGVIALVMVSGALAAPAASQDGKDYFVVEEALPFEPLEGATVHWGIQNGAGYRIEVPENWNGDLVMWAHGYAGTGLELFVQNPPMREYLIEQGYAWAASSYSKNDYNVRTPAKETQRLARSFKKLTDERRPDDVYLAGVSMGGNITAYSAQRYWYYYDAVMPVCGVLTDLENFDYYLDVNLAAQELGGAGSFPVTSPEQWIGADVPTIKENLSGPAPGWPLVLNEDGNNLKGLVEDRSGGDRPNFDEGWAFWNSIPSDAGDGNFLFGLAIDSGTVPIDGQFSGNADTVYQFDADPAISAAEQEFNDSVQRVERDRLSRGDRREIPENTGRFPMPMLTMHNLGDLFVPFQHEIEFAKRVQENGNPDLLVQRALRGAGHCDFTEAEYVEGFEDLVSWVQVGDKPDGDPMLDPAAIAEDGYGCLFTIGEHLAAAPCDEPRDDAQYGPELDDEDGTDDEDDGGDDGGSDDGGSDDGDIGDDGNDDSLNPYPANGPAIS